MKKLSALFIAAAILAALCSCSRGDGISEKAPASAAPAQSPQIREDPGEELQQPQPPDRESGEADGAPQESSQSSEQTGKEDADEPGRSWTYPVTADSPDWKDYDYSQLIEMCQMPEDLLREADDAELAGLLLDYPFILDYLAWDDPGMFFEGLEERLNIYGELMSRDGANDALIDAYAALEVDYEGLVKGEYENAYLQSGYGKQMFLEEYFFLYKDALTDSQTERLLETALEKIDEEESSGMMEKFNTFNMFNTWVLSESGEDGESGEILLPEV